MSIIQCCLPEHRLKMKFRTPEEILKVGRRLLARLQKVDLFWIVEKHPVSTLLSASEHFQ